MKTSFIFGIIAVAISLSPSISSANSDDSEYPATNFQPKVIYQDKDVIQTSGSAASTGEKSAHDPDYPASTFAPKVLFQDKEALSANTYAGEKSTFDPKYPAANFTPKVIYP